MNSDFLKAYIKDAVGKALKSGASTMLEEMVDTLPVEQLEELIKVLSKVVERKRNVVDVKSAG